MSQMMAHSHVGCCYTGELLEDEFDFRVEAQRVDEFAEAFVEAGFDHLVQLPRVVHSLTTRKVQKLK